MIMLDAFGYNQVISTSKHYLNELIPKSIFGSVKPLFAFRGIQPTIFSGVNPNKHGIWMDYYFDEEKSSYRWTKRTIIPSLESLKNRFKDNYIKKVITAPICYTSKYFYNYSQFPRTTLIPWNQLKNFTFSMTEEITKPGVLAPHDTIFDIFQKNKITYKVIDFPNVHSDSDTLNKIKRIQGKSFNKDFYFFRFFNLDEIIHDHGLNSQKTKNGLRYSANLVKIVKKMIESKVDDYYLLIFSDHGMVDVSEIVNSRELLDEIEKNIEQSFKYFIDSIMIRFKLNNQLDIEKLKACLNRNQHGIVLTEEIAKKFGVNMTTTRYGDVCFVLNKGKMFLPNFYQAKSKIKAMHGYHEEDMNLNPFLLLYKNQSNIKKNVENISFLDIVPTILNIFDITPNMAYLGNSLL